MIYNSFSDEELSLIGESVAGTFHHHEVDNIIFGSHTWPSHRIAIDRQAARLYIEGVVKPFGEHCQAD